METGIDDIDLQVGLSGDILEEHNVEQEVVQYATTSSKADQHHSEEYLIGQWTTTAKNKPEQAYFIQTQATTTSTNAPSNAYNDTNHVKKKSNVVAKKRKGNKVQHHHHHHHHHGNHGSSHHGQTSSSSSSGRDGYRFSCDHCALTFIDPKEAIEHISQTHMPSKSAQEHQYEQETTTVVQPEPAPEQLQVDMSGHHHVRHHHGQQQVLLLVDDNELVEEDQTHTYRIQYTNEPPPPPQTVQTVPQQPNEQTIITQEMGRKVEMIKAARTQKRLAKLQQQSMKQHNHRQSHKNAQQSRFLDKSKQKSKSNAAQGGSSRSSLGSGSNGEMNRKRKQSQPQQHTQLRTVQIEQTQVVHEQVDQVMHINHQLDPMDTVINNIDNDSVLESGQGSVVVSNQEQPVGGASGDHPIEQIHIDQSVQFAQPIDEVDPTGAGGVELNAHDMFKVQDDQQQQQQPGTSSNQAQNDKVGRLADVKPVHIGEKRFRCEKCGKTFFRKNKLLQHMDGHAEEKMHICHVCGKRFQFKTSLVHHLNCHSENPRFKCQFCGKILSAHKMLLKHLVKQHNQVVDRELVPLHKCDICNYKTIYKSDLTKHKRKHTGEKPYRCPICFKEFSDSSILRRHEVVHTGEKPWKCYLCDKAYTLRSTLTNHFKKAHSTWPNPIPACPICKREFENREDIFAHMKEVHGTDPATINAHRHSIVDSDKDTGEVTIMRQQQRGEETQVGLAPGVQIVMNGEPLQIISVDGNSATEQQTIQVDAEGRHFINATAHDGQPLELVVQSEPGHVYDEDVRQGRLVKINPTWQLGKTESERIQTDQGDQHSFPRIVMMNEDPERKYNLLVSGGQNLVSQQQIIYTEASEQNVKGQMTSVVMASASPTAAPVSLIQTVQAVNNHQQQPQSPN